MMVYIVIVEGVYGHEVDKVFTSKVKANAYCNEQNQKYPIFNHYVEEYWAI